MCYDAGLKSGNSHLFSCLYYLNRIVNEFLDVYQKSLESAIGHVYGVESDLLDIQVSINNNPSDRERESITHISPRIHRTMQG